MSDSENDLFPSNMYTYRQENSTISAKGPHINRTLTNANFRNNNMLSSTMLMPKNFGRQNFDERSLYQNSMYSRRETSPSSVLSVPAMPRTNFPNSFYHRNNYTQRSVIDRRATSPMSVRSIDSNASISAVDIAMALKNAQFNKNDLRIIKDAYSSFMKSRSRRRIEKRRKKRFRSERRRSEDSGEQGSNSSDSDDCRSVKTTAFGENVSSSRSNRTDLSYLKHSLKESNIYKDCTDYFRQNSLKTTLPTSPQSIHGDTFRHHQQNNIGKMRFKAPRSVCSESHIRNTSVAVLKDRFKGSNNFLLPSQRFNKSVAASTILESTHSNQFTRNNINVSTIKKPTTIPIQNKQIVSYPTDSDEDNLEQQYMQSKKNCVKNGYNSPQRKRQLDENDGTPSSKKRNKNISPKKTTAETQKISQKTCPSPRNNDFEFVKPTLPIRKPINEKTNEILISKSVEPKIIASSPPNNHAQSNKSKNIYDETLNSEKQIDNPYSNVSMRPSFIKRKLFSQKLDVTEAKSPSDSSPDTKQANSYNGLMKEKTKARKLVANQSCLSRDITAGNNNYLDLIHKIVPPERMNVTTLSNATSVTNATKRNESQEDPTDSEDKWDVTSVISTCNKNNESDTFTDEEMFSFSTKSKKPKTNSTVRKPDTEELPQNNDDDPKKPIKTRGGKKKEANELIPKPQVEEKSMKKTVDVQKKPQKSKTEEVKESNKLVQKHNEEELCLKKHVDVDKKSQKSRKDKEECPKDSNTANLFIQPKACTVVAEKISIDAFKKPKNNTSLKDAGKTISNYVDNFFETDYETDSESRKKEISAMVMDVKKVVVKKTATPKPKSVKTPSPKKDVAKRLTPVPSLPEIKKKPGLKNYFQRILKGKNKENIPNHESSNMTVDNTKMNEKNKMDLTPSVHECKNTNYNHVEKVKQIQDIVKKARNQLKTTKNNENDNQTFNHAQTNKLDETVINNTKSKRVRTPSIHKLTLDISNNLQKRNTNKKETESQVKRPRGRPKKNVTLPPEETKIQDKAIGSNISLNTSMTLRARNKQITEEEKTAKPKNKKQNNIKTSNTKTTNEIKSTKSNKADKILNASMTLRTRKPTTKNASFVY